jgi:hypothetical protein
VRRIVIRVENTESGIGARTSPSRWRRILAASSIAATLLALTIAAVADEGPVVPTGYTPISHTLFGGRSIAAHKTTTAVVLGGATTVPYDANSVKLKVTVTGRGAGSLLVAPLGSSQTKVAASFNESQPATGYVTVAPGTSSSVVFTNLANVTVTVTAVLVAFSVPDTPHGLHATLPVGDSLPVFTLPDGDALTVYCQRFPTVVAAAFLMSHAHVTSVYTATSAVTQGGLDAPTNVGSVFLTHGSGQLILAEPTTTPDSEFMSAIGHIVLGTDDQGVWTVDFGALVEDVNGGSCQIDATVVHSP